jgi:peptide/nickel transport system permease protein
MNALGYVLRRIGVAIVLLVALTFLTFLIYAAIPASPGRILLQSQHPSTEDVALANHALGTDRPLTTQYADWAGNVLRGDFGFSWLNAKYDYQGHADGPSVTSSILPATGVSLSIVLGGLVVLLSLVVPLAAMCASRPDGWFDRLTAGFLLIGISTHPLVVGILLQSFAANKLQLLPNGGYCTIRPPTGDAARTFGACSGVGEWAHHLVLPWITFAIFFAALYVRVLRVSLIETLGEPYVSTARAKGASEARVLFRHALRNALRPILTMTGMEAGTAVTILVYIEIVFGLPGLGRLSVVALNGTTGYDRPVIAAVVLFIGIAVFGLNLLVDLLYPLVDKRVARLQAPRRFAPSSPTG